MQGPSSLFCPFPLGQQKQRQTSEAWGAEVFLSPFPRRDAGPLISFFFFSRTGNKSSGRAKPGCCSFFTPLNNEDRRQSAPLTETMYCTSTRRASSRYAGETGKRNLCFACVLPWFGLTDGALGAKEWKLGFAYTVRARYGPVLTSSDDPGVVVMVSRPSAVPNGPWRANCGLCAFCLGLASPTGQWGPRSGNSAFLARCVRVMDQC